MLKKTIALFLLGIIPMFAAVSPRCVYASQMTLISLPGDDGDSTCFSIGTGGYLTGAVTCASRVALTGNPCNWSAKLTGELAIGYTNAAAAFGYNGGIEKEMKKSTFVYGIYGTEIRSFSKSANMFTFIDEDKGATVTLYW